MAKRVPVPRFEMTVTRAAMREFRAYGHRGGTEYRLCLTGTTPEGQRLWAKFPEFQGTSAKGQPLAAEGDQVLLQAKVKGASDDGAMTYLKNVKLLAVLGPEEVPALAQAA